MEDNHNMLKNSEPKPSHDEVAILKLSQATYCKMIQNVAINARMLRMKAEVK